MFFYSKFELKNKERSILKNKCIKFFKSTIAYSTNFNAWRISLKESTYT